MKRFTAMLLTFLILFSNLATAARHIDFDAETYNFGGAGVLSKAELYRLQGVTSNIQTQIDGKVSDTAYDSTTWNGVTAVAPSKNAVRDQIEALVALVGGGVSDVAYDSTSWDGVTTVAPSKNAVRDQVETLVTSIALKAPLASPALTGNPTAPTQSPGDNSTKIATTAYADAGIAAKVTGPASATDNAPVRFDSTTGKLVQNSANVTIDDSGMTTIVGASGGLSGIYNQGIDRRAFAGDGSVTTGTNATLDLTSLASSFISVSSSSLVSIQQINNRLSGKIVAILNGTGNTINIVNDPTTGAASNYIYTGTGANLPVKNNQIVQFIYEGTRWKVLGVAGGSGSGEVNYLTGTNADAEGGQGDWLTYKDTAATAPVDGNLGSPTITYAPSTSSPLEKTNSFLFTKDAANRQGEGAAVNFTIEPVDQGNMVRVFFKYTTSANYVDDDVVIYAYDRINGGAAFEITNKGLKAGTNRLYIGEFQAPSNSTDFRFIIHQSSTSALAYTIKFDLLRIAPQTISKGLVGFDQKTFTPSVSGFGTVTNAWGEITRIGDKALVKFGFTPGTVGSSTSITLPFGLNWTSTTPTQEKEVGGWTIRSTAQGNKGIMLTSTATNVVYFGNPTTQSTGGASPLNAATGTGVFTSGQDVIGQFTVTIAGWQSGMALSEDGGTSKIELYAAGNAGQTVTADTVRIPFIGITDTAAIWNGTQLTVPETGRYDFSGLVNGSSANTGAVYLYNETLGVNIGYASNGLSQVQKPINISRDLLKGHVISLRVDVTTTINNSGSLHHLSIAKRSSPQTLAGGASVYAIYSTAAGQSVVDSSTIIFGTLIKNSHAGSYNTSTGDYSCPTSGMYRFKATTTVGTVSVSSGNSYAVDVYNASSGEAYIGDYWEAQVTRGTNAPGTVDALMYCSQGQIVRFRFNEGIPAANLVANGVRNYMNILRVGN